MKANAIAQLILSAVIVVLIFLLIVVVRKPEVTAEAVGAAAKRVTPTVPRAGTETVAAAATTGVPAATTGAVATTGVPTATDVVATAGVPELQKSESYPHMNGSTVFVPIISKPTPPPTPAPRTPTPKEPPPIAKLLEMEGWRLADVWKGRAQIERTKRAEGTPDRWIELKVGDSIMIYYDKESYEIKIISMDEKDVTVILGFGDQRHPLKAF